MATIPFFKKRAIIFGSISVVAIAGLVATFVYMGTISADTNQKLAVYLNEENCVAGENYKIVKSKKNGWLTNVTLTGNYITLGSQTSPNLQKFQNLPVEYKFTLYFLDVKANLAAFFANGLDRQEMPERIVARTYRSGKFRNDISIGKLTYSPNSLTSEVGLNRYIDEGFDRIDFIRIAANDSKNTELVASCSAEGVARAAVGASKYQKPAISVNEYAKAFNIDQCTPGSGWKQVSQDSYRKNYSLVDPKQQPSDLVRKLIGQPLNLTLRPSINKSQATFYLGYYFDPCPISSKVDHVDLPEKIKTVITLKDGSQRQQTTRTMFVWPTRSYCFISSKGTTYHTPGFEVEWRDVQKYDFYRVSTSNPPVEEPVASCVRGTPVASTSSPAISPTLSVSPQASPTQTTSRSSQATKSPSPSPTPSLSPIASRSVGASDIRSATPTPKRSTSPTSSPSPARRSTQKIFWYQATAIGSYLKSAWKTVSSWFKF